MSNLNKVYSIAVDIKNVEGKYSSYAKFFDDDRDTSIIKIKLLNNNYPIDLEGCTVEAEFILANNTYHDETCKIINTSEGIVELQLCQECLVAGKNTVRLSILKENEIANTPVITYEVKKGLYSDNPNFNDDPLTPVLSQMLLDVKVTKANQIELQERYEQSFPRIELKIKEVDEKIKEVNLAIASGTQDLEVKEARANKKGIVYAKLGDRLDAVDSQLDHRASELEDKKFNKDGILSMSNMGQDIKEAMTGGSVAVVGENAILRENIVNNQVTYEKTDFLEIGKNMFNRDRVTAGYYVDDSDGNLVPYSNRYATEYINVDSNSKYTFTDQFPGAFYDVNKKYISGFNAVTTVTTPSNCAYIRKTIGVQYIDTYMVVKGDSLGGYEPYCYKLKKNESIEPIYEIKPSGKNIIDAQNRENGYILHENGHLVESTSSWCTTEFLPVEANKVYSTTNVRYVVQYNQYKNPIPNTFSDIPDGTISRFTTNKDAKFIKATIRISYLDKSQIEKGSPTDVEPIKYGVYAFGKKIIDLNNFQEEKSIITSIKQEIENARVNSHGNNFQDLKERIDYNESLLDQTNNPQTPKAMMDFIVARLDNSVVNNGIGGYITLYDVYQVYDNFNKMPGAWYGIEYPLSDRTTQRVVKSIDGGNTWSIIGTLKANVESGERYTNIFVAPHFETIVLLKATNWDTTAIYTVETYPANDLTNRIGSLDIGTHYWHDSVHNIDSMWANPNEVIMFAEYGKGGDGDYRVWRTINKGASWQMVLSLKDTELKHFHTCQFIGPTAHEWLLSCGDGNGEHGSRVWESKDSGSTWELKGGGSQDYRFLGVIVDPEDPNYIYWGMDCPNTDIRSAIYKVDRRTYKKSVIGYQTQDNAIYSLTRTYLPNGFLIFPQNEPNYINNGYTDIQFYDFTTQKMSKVASINNFGISGYIGFNFSSRAQDCITGGVIVGMSETLAFKYAPYQSRHAVSGLMRLKLTL